MKFLKIKLIFFTLILFTQATPAEPIEKKVLIIGDSLGDGFWLGINNDRDRLKNEKIKTIKGSVQGQSMTGKNFSSYVEKIKKMRSEINPDFVVIWIGANDQAPEGKSSEQNSVYLNNFQMLYKKNALLLLDAIKVSPEKVYWVSLPKMRSPKSDNNAHTINAILKQISSERKLHFVDIEKSLSDGNGNFSKTMNYNGKFIQTRADDGVHFTTIGYKLISKLVTFN
jgi:hypothetical protein